MRTRSLASTVRPHCFVKTHSFACALQANRFAWHTGSLFVKGVADTNAAALDKALEALLVFLSKANESHAARWEACLLAYSCCVVTN